MNSGTIKKPDGSFKSVARTIKYRGDLEGKQARRTLEKFEIEKRFWAGQHVDWAIVTEEMFSPDLIKNLGLLRKFAQLPRALAEPSLHTDFLGHLASCRPYPWSTAESLRKIAARLFISYQDSRALYHHLIWAKSIKVDLVGTPIQMTAPLPTFEIIEKPMKISLTAEGLS
ncbi:hypothetical protein GIV66_21720 [Pseudomonas sp. PA-3-11C]|uniref:TnsA endonuclease N-terminal domain-containing protein n=1 Tax=unclassified Pseudomonas TaxID=196821 RepID=UPI001F385A65|nr:MULTISPECIES: TnsA endonuclease N-terminal domain-containing protein [unclassified Pseudomonas]MCF5510393.1 hypothetical protein [Pseudomonas sp. PA-3-6H]MCF5517914.1 hypothetical protein [Pseudomonas sp. PA-3-6E]MCF5564727.1 hypothetical protein [Pseudomonas sp. PA-3-5D]MCF5569462.1 hypothetical protein [Pseudomonas sp. PA-3-11C]MCF5595450.1 hypothetical protein [Pseudomonas sp. PA-3-10C]